MGAGGGFTEVAASAGAWCYATPEEVAWWSSLWADRTTASAYASIAADGGHATPAELSGIAEAWHAWGAAPDAWFSVLHGEVLARA